MHYDENPRVYPAECDIALDLTPDSCAVLVYASEDGRDALGGSIAGAAFEHDGDGHYYALVGDPWDDSLSDAENDQSHDRWQELVEAEIAAVGLRWYEC